MLVIVITIVFNYFSLYAIVSVHTCIILVSMYLHCYILMSVHTCINSFDGSAILRSRKSHTFALQAYGVAAAMEAAFIVES